MALARVKVWGVERLLSSDLNAEFNNFINNAISLISPLPGSLDWDGYAHTLDAAGVTTVQSTSTIAWSLTPGSKSGTPSMTGVVSNWAANTFTDTATAGSGTAAAWTGNAFQRPTLAAANANVTTTHAATVYIANSPAAGSNETITNAWSLWVDDGPVRFDGNATFNNRIITSTAIGAPMGTYGIRGCTGANNVTSPTVAYDFDSDVIVVSDTNRDTLILYNQGSQTNNHTSFAAGGRDQASAFGANSWIHYYWIWNGTTLSTLASTTAPPVGPTLPSSYTHWGYITCIRYNGALNLEGTRVRGSWVFYDAFKNALTGGAATSQTAVAVSSLIPPNATQFQYFTSTEITAAAGVINYELISVAASGNGFHRMRCVNDGMSATGNWQHHGQCLRMPNIDQTMYYYFTITAGSSQAANIDVMGYQIPNGGE